MAWLAGCFAATAQPSAPELRHGPWGTLRVSSFWLRTPETVIASAPLPDASEWIFAGLSPADATALLTSVGLSLTELPHTVITPDDDAPTLAVQVPADLRRHLTARTREVIYPILARSAFNPAHVTPFQVPSDAQLERSQLAPALLSALRELSFTVRGQRLLVDADLLLPLATDADQRRLLLRLLHRYEALRVELLRETLDQADAANTYWNPHGEDPLTPWLERFATSPQLESTDIGNLLPPLPRRLLHSFPDAANSPADANCFWTSLNFFRRDPNDRLLPYQFEDDQSEATARAELAQNYTPATPPYAFGDVWALFVRDTPDARPRLIHLAVHLADDLVLTKNGAGKITPFMITRLSAVTGYYGWAQDLTVRVYRPRPGSPAMPAPAL